MMTVYKPCDICWLRTEREFTTRAETLRYLNGEVFESPCPGGHLVTFHIPQRQKKEN